MVYSDVGEGTAQAMKSIHGVSRFWAVLTIALMVCGVVGCGGSDQPHYATVTIDTTPVSGAKVVINDVTYGVTPVTIKSLPANTYFVTAQKDGYKRAIKPLAFPSVGKAHYTLKLERRVGYLTLDSTPSPAKVVLDGADVLGQTPMVSHPIPIGRHTFTVTAARCIPATKLLDVQEDYVYQFNYDLKPKPARLIVYSTPSGGQIWLNNQIQADITPATFTLPPGKYVVSVYVKGYASGEKDVTLDPAGKKSVELKLVPGSVPPGMVLIPAGYFLMGLNGPSPDERPQRRVFLKAYYIDRCEVTNAQYKAVFPSYTFEKGEEQCPVHGVNYYQAAAYARRVGKRLPTEAEWEKAARGTDGREYPWGENFNPKLCNCKDSGYGKVCPVGQYFGGASPYGCLDMAGNVYEWTSTWYEPYPGNKEIHTNYGQEFKVLRGGSYRSGFFELRCARRHFDHPDAAKPDYGFRCAKDVEVGPSDDSEDQ